MKVAAIYLSQRSFPRLYNPNGLELSPGDICIVEDSQVVEAPGRVALVETRCEVQMERGSFPRVLRMASEVERDLWGRLKQREIEAMRLAKDASRRLNLDMKITTVRFDDRQRRVIFNFTADQRVDFRQLVRELASGLKARIELWQIGVRDESKAIHGFGLCGQHLCCSTWIKEFKPVSIRQAKDQDLMLSPAKLSGQCGRLLCCLTYEHEHYRETAKSVPAVGAICRTKAGEEVTVLDRNLLALKFLVRDSQGHTKTIYAADIGTVVGKAPPSALKQDTATRLAAMSGASARANGGGNDTPAEEAEERVIALEDEPSPPMIVTPDDSAAPQSKEQPAKRDDSRRHHRRFKPRRKDK